MKNLQLVKSENFGSVEADIYSNGNDMFMTIDQLAGCLEYTSRDAIEKMLTRNSYLKTPEFSVTDKLSATDGKQYNTRVFTEDGIYEVTMLSNQPKAKEFRAWIRKILKGLRKGDLKLVPAKRTLSATNTAAKIIGQTLEKAGMPPQYVAVAIKSLYAPVGVEIPLDGIKTDKQLFDCTAIADELGLVSKTGKPHNQAVAAIITQLSIDVDEKTLVPFQSQSSGHSGPTWQYTQSVVDKVCAWISCHKYPSEIVYKGKSYKVYYNKNAA
ncbi:BRO-N domain-containing protein [Clostridium minihomine]|uniref:BRO-N domain-containing protein n=1 Tax=Clostridium minihomine TaxID=2045012 RepID=UPI000C75D538|nr:Bro-N domain-containing protein [Clostridium minihomine]